MSRTPRREGTILVLRGRRRSMSHVARSQERARQQEGWCRRVPRSADELGDAGELVLIEVVDGAIVQELPRQEQ